MIIRKLTASLLLFFMLFCITKNTALLSLYEINQELFVSLLCENKSRPSLHCEGKCQLSKIAKEQQKEKAEKVLSQLQAEVFFYYQSPAIPSFACTTVLTAKYTPTGYPSYSYIFTSSNDRPPAYLA